MQGMGVSVFQCNFIYKNKQQAKFDLWTTIFWLDDLKSELYNENMQYPRASHLLDFLIIYLNVFRRLS
jgi:hypothetical protein